MDLTPLERRSLNLVEIALGISLALGAAVAIVFAVRSGEAGLVNGILILAGALGLLGGFALIDQGVFGDVVGAGSQAADPSGSPSVGERLQAGVVGLVALVAGGGLVYPKARGLGESSLGAWAADVMLVFGLCALLLSLVCLNQVFLRGRPTPEGPGRIPGGDWERDEGGDAEMDLD